MNVDCSPKVSADSLSSITYGYVSDHIYPTDLEQNLACYFDSLTLSLRTIAVTLQSISKIKAVDLASSGIKDHYQ